MSLGRAVATVGGFTLLSRLVGFIRDIVLSAVLGSGAVADAFFVAFKLPNFFRRLFAEGAFSAAFVPLFSRELQGHGRDQALAFARQAHAGLLLVLVPFSVLLMLGMPGVLALLAPGMRDDAPTFAMAVEFGRITFPYLLFISLASLYGGVLNSIDRFAHVAATPILLNLALIGAVLGLTPLLPNSGYAASIGVAIAGLLQWLWLLIACARDGVSMKLVRPRWTERVARLVKLATPVAIGGGVQQISVMLDVVWASLLPVGTISALYYADRIAQLPLGVVGIAIGTALLPLLARQLRAGQAQSAMANQNRAIEFGLLFSLPSAVALWLLADPHHPRAVRAWPLRARRHLAHGGRAGRLCRRPAGLRAGQGADAGLLRPRGHQDAALHRDRRDRRQHRAQCRLPLRHDARPGRHRARLLAVGLAERRPAGASSCGGARSGCPTSGWSRGRSAWWARRPAWAPLLWLALVVLAPSLAHANLAGVAALLGICAWGAAAYAALGRAVGRRQAVGAALRAAPPARPQVTRPRRTTVTPGRSGRFDEGITSTQLS